jgi:hypothetical protein
MDRIVNRIARICQRECANAESTIPLVQRNSDFGYEPTMGYQCDEESLRWKCKHMDYVLTSELPAYRKK